MTMRTIEEDIYLELRSRILSRIDTSLKNSTVNSKLFRLEAQQTGREIWENFHLNELLTQKNIDQKDVVLRIVAGKVGCGRTSLGLSILRDWLAHDNSCFKDLSQYKLCLIIDRTKLHSNGALLQLQSWLPDTLIHWGQSSLSEWLKSGKILLIVDNFLLESELVENLHALMDSWKGSEAIVLTNLTTAENLEDFVRGKKFFYCQFQVLNNMENKDIFKHFTSFYAINSTGKTTENGISVFLDTIGGIKYVCESMRDEIIRDAMETVSEVAWNITFEKVNAIAKVHSLSENKVDEWLTILGQISYECLIRKTSLMGDDIEYLLIVSNRLFPELLDAKTLSDTILRYQVSHCEGTVSTWNFQHEVQQEVFASWYVLQKCMDGLPMKRLLKKIECEDPFAIYAAVLLKTLLTDAHKFFKNFEDDYQKREKKIERVIKNLGVQTERSSDPISFIFRVVHEMHGHPLLTKLFLQDSYIPPHLHIRDIAIYKDAIQAVIDHSPPTKVYLLVRKKYHPPQLYSTLSYLQSMPLEVALALMNHLEWKSNIRSNDYLEILNQSGSSLSLVDFIGCLDKHVILELHKWKATKNLVCLRVRVCNGESAISLVNCQDNLKSLMWLEIDFDFPLPDVLKLSIPKIRTPLIDLSFNNVCDSDITNICDFLHSISLRYSGIHIHESSVSSQGVIELLKYFYRRSMTMNADPKAVNKYRKYRFPEFSYVDPREEIDDEKAERMLGYDDRHHYSDNEIHSSHLCTNEEVNTLKFFFGAMTEVRYFKYSCMNCLITKESDGSCLVTKSIV